MDPQVVIRRPVLADAPALARIHVDAWRSTYAGIVPDRVLAEVTHDVRERQWRKWLADQTAPSSHVVAEVQGDGAVGFATYGPERSGHPLYRGELWGIYILPNHQRRGIGRRLVGVVAEELLRRGLSSLLVWVLKDNPCRAFYERLGGVYVQEKDIDIGGTRLVEVAYGWPDLQPLLKANGARAGGSQGE